jgi:hypothetical protein
VEPSLCLIFFMGALLRMTTMGMGKDVAIVRSTVGQRGWPVSVHGFSLSLSLVDGTFCMSIIDFALAFSSIRTILQNAALWKRLVQRDRCLFH